MYEYKYHAEINVTFTCIVRIFDDVLLCCTMVGEYTICKFVNFIVNSVPMQHDVIRLMASLNLPTVSGCLTVFSSYVHYLFYSIISVSFLA